MKAKIILFYLLLTVNYSLSLYAQTWNTVGDKFYYNDSTPRGDVFALKKIDTLLYIGGDFTHAGNMNMNCIATWDGVKWDSLGSGLGDYYISIYDVSKYDNEIFAGGYYRFMKWNDTSWAMVGTGLSIHNVKTLKEYNGKLYFGGDDFHLNSTNLNNVASWDGTNYAGLNGGVWGDYSHVQALTEFNNELIVGGEFSYAGNKVMFNIARWDGVNWNALDTGTNAMVEALTVDTINNFLYVGGGFTGVGGTHGIHTVAVARWDGYQWDSISLPYCDVRALCMYHKKLFAGMCLNGGLSNPPGFAKWNGKTWEIIPGLINTINALCVYKDELYVGGYSKLIVINLDTIDGIARYYEPPDTSCDYLQAIIEPHDLILKTSDSTTVHFYNNIIHGSSWRWNFGDGATDTVRLPVHAYAWAGVYNVSVIVTYQNCTDTAYTTVTIDDDTGIKNNKDKEPEYLLQNIPNPPDSYRDNKITTIPYYVPVGSKGSLQIIDANGKPVKEYNLQQGKNKLEISLAQLKTGIYYYSITINGVKKKTLKMMIE